MTRSTVLIVEDDDRTRRHLAASIAAHPQLSLAGEAASCAEARRCLDTAAPDVLLTDLGLPDGSGIELIRETRKLHPSAQIMVITVFGDEQNVIASIEAGASGYLLKDGTTDEITEGVLALLDGGSPMSVSIARHLLRRFQHQAAPPAAEAGPLAPGSATDETAPHLTERETEVLRLVSKGLNKPEIARVLEISAHTVSTHVRHIYEKLEVGSQGAAVYEAVQLGLIQMDD
jgi:DNA-binding NarL/FixJ family response regulator